MSRREQRPKERALPLQALAQRFTDGARAMGIAVPSGSDAQVALYIQELVHWSRAYNLIGPVEPMDIVERHVLDGLSVLPYVRGPVIDVGSGAGLPAVPLALAAPALEVTALDANGKKARFIRHVQRSLQLPNLQVAQVRAELFRPPQPFATVVSRAFASLELFLRVTAHLAAVNGRWLAMKGKLQDSERAEVPPEYVIVAEQPLKVPGTTHERMLVILERRR